MKHHRIKLPNGRRIKIQPDPLAKLVEADKPAGPMHLTYKDSTRTPQGNDIGDEYEVLRPEPIEQLTMETRPAPSQSDPNQGINATVDIQLTRQQRDVISSTLTAIPRMVNSCQRVSAALVATHRSLIRPHSVLSFFFPTDYQRTRKRIIRLCSSAYRQLRTVRRKNISPEAILAMSDLKGIQSCCRKCLKSNIENRIGNRKFTCQVSKNHPPVVREGFGF